MKHLRTYSKLCNESLRDEMKPKSENDLKAKLGNEKYVTYTKLADIQETINKKPFRYNTIQMNATPIFLEIKTELDDFNIEYTNDKYVLHSNGIFKFNTKDDLISKIKSITLDSIDSYEKDKLEEINILHNQLKYIKEEMSFININF